MPSTTIYNRGEVVVVHRPFSNGSGTKPRPALIISDHSLHGAFPDVIVCPISSQPRYYSKPGPGDCPLRAWQALNLRYASTVLELGDRIAAGESLRKKQLDFSTSGPRRRLRTYPQ